MATGGEEELFKEAALGRKGGCCQVCRKEAFKYTCPRCETLFCSASCYRTHGGGTCAAAFNEACAMDAIRAARPTAAEIEIFSRQLSRMYLRERQQQDEEEDEEEEHEQGGEDGRGKEKDEKLTAASSRRAAAAASVGRAAAAGTAATQAAGVGRKREEEGEEKKEAAQAEAEEDEEEEGLLLQDERHEQLMSLAEQELLTEDCLTEEELRAFHSAVKRGLLQQYLQPWTPWWTRAAVEVDSTPASPPSHCCCSSSSKGVNMRVINAVVQLLYAYAHCMRSYNGEIEAVALEGACQHILSVAKAVGAAEPPASATEALDAALQSVVTTPVQCTDTAFNHLCLRDVPLLLRFRDNACRAVTEAGLLLRQMRQMVVEVRQEEMEKQRRIEQQQQPTPQRQQARQQPREQSRQQQQQQSQPAEQQAPAADQQHQEKEQQRRGCTGEQQQQNFGSQKKEESTRRGQTAAAAGGRTRDACSEEKHPEFLRQRRIHLKELSRQLLASERKLVFYSSFLFYHWEEINQTAVPVLLLQVAAADARMQQLVKEEEAERERRAAAAHQLSISRRCDEIGAVSLAQVAAATRGVVLSSSSRSRLGEVSGGSVRNSSSGGESHSRDGHSGSSSCQSKNADGGSNSNPGGTTTQDSRAAGENSGRSSAANNCDDWRPPGEEDAREQTGEKQLPQQRASILLLSQNREKADSGSSGTRPPLVEEIASPFFSKQRQQLPTEKQDTADG